MAKKSMINKQQKTPKFSTRAYTRCSICGRPHAVLRKYGVCRTFGGCASLEEITLPFVGNTKSANSNSYHFGYIFGANNANNIPASLKTVNVTGDVAIAGNAFNGCANITTVTIPNVTSIGASAFQNCSSLTEIEIPQSVTAINASAFNGCAALQSASLRESLTQIGANAFMGCSLLNN